MHGRRAGPEAGSDDDPAQRIAGGEIPVDAVADGLLVRVPAERSERLPADTEGVIFGREDAVACGDAGGAIGGVDLVRVAEEVMHGHRG